MALKNADQITGDIFQEVNKKFWQVIKKEKALFESNNKKKKRRL